MESEPFPHLIVQNTKPIVMKNIGIRKPCTENWKEMTPTTQGAFCQKCVKQVHDFTGKSNMEIKQILLENNDQSLCAKMTVNQELSLNAEYEFWLYEKNKADQVNKVFLFAFLLVVGLSLLSCNNPQVMGEIQQVEKEVTQILTQENEENTAAAIEFTQGKIAPFEETSEPELMGEVVYLEPRNTRQDFTLPPPHESDTINYNDAIELTRRRTDLHIVGMMVSAPAQIEFFEDTLNPIEKRYTTEGKLIPEAYQLTAFPNPTNAFTKVRIDIIETTLGELLIYDLNGKKIRTLDMQKLEPKQHEIDVDLSNLPKGVYLIVFNSKTFRKSIKVIKH
jgi:hypothetical protein